jgi:hypothetical protein
MSETTFDPSRERNSSDDFAPAQQLTRTDSELREVDPVQTRIVLPENISRGDAVFYLASRTPKSEFGLPMWFYRSDLLPPLDQLTQGDVDAAAEGLFYHDGYPTTQYGKSFWNQLPHEPHTAHRAFEAFIDQAQELGIRQLDLLSAQPDIEQDLETLQQLSREFYWSARARAYDLFIVAAEQKKREYRIRNMEQSHFNDSGALLARLLEKFQDPDWVDELNAKEAIEALETLVKIQRLSVGLTGQHASSNAGQTNTQGASAEFILRKITQGVGGMNGDTSNAFSSKLDQLLADPEAGMQLQELILRVNTTDSQMQGADVS